MSEPTAHAQIWQRYDAIEARLTAGLSARMLDLAEVYPGMRVLDLGAGRGEPAIEAAKRVGPSGRVLCVDPDASVLAMAEARAQAEGVSNLDWRVADAESLTDLPRGAFDVVTCRWSLMYMARPLDALTNAADALRANGVLIAALWAEPERVSYYTLPRRALEPWRAMPEIDPEAPGPFRYASVERIEHHFARAGFEVSSIEEREVDVFESSRADEVVAWARTFGMERLLESLPLDAQLAWEARFTDALEARRAESMLRLGGTTRLVVAKPR